MKYTLILTAAFICHLAPAASIVAIATGGELIHAFAAAALLASALGCGYFHGMNRTLI